MQFRKTKCRKGFTLTEAAIVLAILGVVLGAIWVAAGQVIDASRANRTAQDISTIASNIRATFLSANAFTMPTGNNIAAMVNAGVIPANLLTGNPAAPAKDDYTGLVFDSVRIFTVLNGRTFRVSFYNTPADACFRIANQLISLGTDDGPTNLITNSGSNSVSIPHPNVGAGAATVNRINNACAANTGSVNASTEFDFNIH